MSPASDKTPYSIVRVFCKLLPFIIFCCLCLCRATVFCLASGRYHQGFICRYICIIHSTHISTAFGHNHIPHNLLRIQHLLSRYCSCNERIYYDYYCLYVATFILYFRSLSLHVYISLACTSARAVCICERKMFHNKSKRRKEKHK